MTISIRNAVLVYVLIVVAIILVGCAKTTEILPTKDISTATPSKTVDRPTRTATSIINPIPTSTRPPVSSSTPAPTLLPEEIGLDPEDWMNWPVLPIITKEIQEVYELGQSLGRDAKAFSIFGDCQSTPEEFLGIYENSREYFSELPEYLQETVDYFEGSLSHDSPTVKSGTTTGALLWEAWHEGRYGCQPGERPIDCEIRNNNPAFTIISVGTHYEKRNAYYLEIIIEELLSKGIIPILSTKADNREGDHRINLETAQLAVKYNLPLWNFWAATSHLPDNGLIIQEGNEFLGKIYFKEEVKDIHRLTALQTLDKLRRTLDGSN